MSTNSAEEKRENRLKLLEDDIGRALRVYRAAWRLLFGFVALAGAAVLLLT